MSDGGKGSKPRPISVSNEEYAARWDAIFAKDSEEIKKKFLSEVDQVQEGTLLVEEKKETKSR